MTSNRDVCPCGSGADFSDCCGLYIRLGRSALTAEALMRSRYTAFVLRNEQYLRKTWHPDYCPTDIRLDDESRWLGLKVVCTEGGNASDKQGTVEFVARYKVAGRGYRLHEISRFMKVGDVWLYMDGESSA